MAVEEGQPSQPQKTMAAEYTKSPGRYTILNRYYTPSTGRRLCGALTSLLFLAGLTALILYLVYRPSKPRLSVVSVSVYNINTSSSPTNAISTSMQFTLVFHNPSDRSSIHYDRLTAYVTYRNTPVTPPEALPPLYQDKDSTVGASPVLGGVFVPVSPEVTEGLKVDREYGVVGLRLVLLGRVKYRSGSFHSAWTGLYVRCDMVLGLRKGTLGQVPLLGEPSCDVDA